MKISVLVICKNAAATLNKCLTSVHWADEIIVLDSGSTDDSVAIAKKYTDHVFVTDWPGFGPQKNRALQHATQDWILSLDADEWISENASKEIQNAIQSTHYVAYRSPRRNWYCGQEIKHGDVGRDVVLRLFKREHGSFSNDIVHEHTIINGPIGKLKNPIMHNSYSDLEDLLTRMNNYTSLSAQARHQRGTKASLFKAITHSLWAFVKSYLLRRGFLDGRMGFIVAVSSAESSYYRYAKLLLLQRKELP